MFKRYGTTRLIAVDAKGNALGEDHPRAKLSDSDVEAMRTMYEEDMASIRQLGFVFGVSKSLAHKIVDYQVRASTPEGYRRVAVRFEEKELRR